MVALAADRSTESKTTVRAEYHKIAAATKVYLGSMVALNAAGYLVPASDTAGLKVVGHCDETVDNTGAAGALSAPVRAGVFKWVNAASGDAIAQADIGRPCYVEDDQTVGNGTDLLGIVAGIVTEIDADGGIWVATVDGILDENGIETVASGAISIYTRTTLISVTGTAAYTLADGVREGQRKNLMCSVAASTPDGTVTPATFADGTNIDFDAVHESCELEWHATGGWRVVHIVATATA